MSELTHVYRWGNNPKRYYLKGRRCRVLARGRMYSCLVEFDDGRREVVSQGAIRRRNDEPLAFGT
jgi:hypothetical protein